MASMCVEHWAIRACQDQTSGYFSDGASLARTKWVARTNNHKNREGHSFFEFGLSKLAI
jgi:hypothetical protein